MQYEKCLSLFVLTASSLLFMPYTTFKLHKLTQNLHNQWEKFTSQVSTFKMHKSLKLSFIVLNNYCGSKNMI